MAKFKVIELVSDKYRSHRPQHSVVEVNRGMSNLAKVLEVYLGYEPGDVVVEDVHVSTDSTVAQVKADGIDYVIVVL